MLKRAVQMASYFGEIPEDSKGYPTKKLRFLVRLCYQLQKLAGLEPFSLSWNDAALALKVTPPTAGDYLRMLIADEIITIVEEHTETQATKYRYSGSSQKMDT